MQNTNAATPQQETATSQAHAEASYVVQVRSKELVTHDVLRMVTDKPPQYQFVPGQATEVAINKEGWKKAKRPFTFTSLPDEDHLEFTTKVYPAHQGVTNELLHLQVQDTLLIGEAFGTIRYKGEGVFIAGGAGVTPFIAIFRQLERAQQVGQNKLIFANKTQADIIHESYFQELLGSRFIPILSGEKVQGYAYGYVTEAFLRAHMDSVNQWFYLCGPEPMMEAVEGQLLSMDVKPGAIVKEQF